MYLHVADFVIPRKRGMMRVAKVNNKHPIANRNTMVIKER